MMEDNRGCLVVFLIIGVALFFVFRANNLQSLITAFGSGDNTPTRLRVIETVPINPDGVEDSIRMMEEALARFASIGEGTAHDLLVAGELPGAFRGGLVLAEVEASRVPWLYKTDKVAIITLHELPGTDQVMLDTVPDLHGISDGGRWFTPDDGEFEGLKGDEGVVYVGSAPVRAPGFADKTLKDDDTEKIR